MITINIAASEKRAHPTEQYSSLMANVSLQGESGSLADAPAVIRELFRVAQAGVEEQLSQQISAALKPASVQSTHPGSDRANGSHRPAPSSPSHTRPAARRSLPGATDSQIRLIRRLLNEDEGRIADFCHDHHVSTLADLDIKRGSAAIDSLKAAGATS